MSLIDEAESPRPVKFSQEFNSSIALPRRPELGIKRLLDVVGALVGLILAAPVMLLIFAYLSIFGNPIFVQQRVGRGGRLFPCFKFRTMVNGAERVLIDYLQSNPAAREEWQRTFKLTNDPRIRPIGHFLRKTSLDELPQLFNVLRGDMSLVGPRPIVPAEVPRYRSRIRAYHRVRPGLTGLWQVSGRNLVSYRRRVALDAVYARRHSLALDALILAKTISVVIGARGAL
jgi:lipopolysaccharide/colanic/teichoic acid biosynthesis glycosyltransferase